MIENCSIFGVICEYNPFHNGHFAHLHQVRAAGATHVVAVMSGNFVQRGDCALLDKQTRAKCALENGADLVLELPLPWAMAGAEAFARGGVGLLNGLGVVEVLAFGTEHPLLPETLTHAAEMLVSADFSAALRPQLESGKSFAAAREAALRNMGLAAVADLLQTPNDILAVEYAKAVAAQGASMRLCPILRTAAGHHDALPDSGTVASATAIRTALREGRPLTEIRPFVPENVAETLAQALSSGHTPTNLDYLTRAIFAKWRTVSAAEARALPDASEGIERRLMKTVEAAGTLSEWLSLAKVKRYSHARLRRLMLAGFLGLTADDAAGIPPYARILAANERGQAVLHLARKRATLPLIARANRLRELDARAQHIAALEQNADSLYMLTRPEVK